jgi:ATP-dependent Clp protease ATP-binding subunit ClpB
VTELERQYADLEEVWTPRRATLKARQHIKEELDTARSEFEARVRAGDLARMSELQYGRIPELEKNLADATARRQEDAAAAQQRHEEEIAEVVSKWTGVPITKTARRRTRKALAARDVSCTSASSARTKR